MDLSSFQNPFERYNDCYHTLIMSFYYKQWCASPDFAGRYEAQVEEKKMFSRQSNLSNLGEAA